jgi:hypothetical protein
MIFAGAVLGHHINFWLVRKPMRGSGKCILCTLSDASIADCSSIKRLVPGSQSISEDAASDQSYHCHADYINPVYYLLERNTPRFLRSSLYPGNRRPPLLFKRLDRRILPQVDLRSMQLDLSRREFQPTECARPLDLLGRQRQVPFLGNFKRRGYCSASLSLEPKRRRQRSIGTATKRSRVSAKAIETVRLRASHQLHQPENQHVADVERIGQ